MTCDRHPKLCNRTTPELRTRYSIAFASTSIALAPTPVNNTLDATMKTALLIGLLVWMLLNTKSFPSGSTNAVQVVEMQRADQGNEDDGVRRSLAAAAAAAAGASSAKAQTATTVHSHEAESSWKDDWDDAYIPRSYSHPQLESPTLESNATDTNVAPTGLAPTVSHGQSSRLSQPSGMTAIILGMLVVSGMALTCG
jgi:hypothetical protein